MSSNYHLICLNHDPPIMLEPQWSDRGEAETAAADPAAHGLPEHTRCSLLIGRWSAALIEVGCPAQHWSTTDPRGHYPYHPCITDWIDVYWLYLLADAAERNVLTMNDGLGRIVSGAPGCWSAVRARRLAAFIRDHSSQQWAQ